MVEAASKKTLIILVNEYNNAHSRLVLAFLHKFYTGFRIKKIITDTMMIKFPLETDLR